MLKLCVVGSGISYTLSPVIHSAALNAAGVSAEYGVEDIPEAEFVASVPRLLRDYDGFNVTKPFKRAIIPYLSRVETGGLDAVNVVTCGADGATGYNTDAEGFALSLRDLAGDVGGMRTLVIGAGGAAEAVVFALSRAGAEVSIYNRTYEKAARLADGYGAAALTGAGDLRGAELIVNCATYCAGAPALPEGTDLSGVRYGYDIVYSPRVTPFMTACSRAGAKVCNGLGMLVYQAIVADGIFTQRKGDASAMYAAAMKAIEENGK